MIAFRRLFSLIWFLALASFGARPGIPGAPVEAEQPSAIANRLIDAALKSEVAFDRLAELCDRFGPRFSGTTNLEAAIDWVLDRMQSDGLENVRAEPVTVPRWVRGEESLELLAPRPSRLDVLGLGGSIGTPPQGITAEVLVVGSFADLQFKGEAARGKIVLFDVPFTTYGDTVRIRTRGAIAAAQCGAVASLIRSVSPFSMKTPHTGMMVYSDSVPKIPHAAITLEDADMLRRFQNRGTRVTVRLKMEARTLPDAPSRNVIAEIPGRERPEEIVVIGGHIDSWDVGQGAMDDAGGCLAAWEAARLIHALGLRPRRTIRVVLWTNEENGLRGALAYRDRHLNELPSHVLAIESDSGVFQPQGFKFRGSDDALPVVEGIARRLERVGATRMGKGAGGADLGPLAERGVPIMDLEVDGSRYFWYHHTAADTPDKLNPGELKACAASLAVMAYLVADLLNPLPTDIPK